ncbi:AMP-binding protein [Rheinheimera sp.]|uniref:AMP-binding protein n=1 Tax=Rheinheimera sp. TaxID=1869214 RepID=UPI0027BA2CAA|nr:AMP-binding protein [Rheinheimera sp.]
MKLNFPATAKLTDVQSGESLDLSQLMLRVQQWQLQLNTLQAKKVVLLSPGNVEWVLLDLACIANETVLVPLPTYLSESQISHVLQSVEPDVIVSSTELKQAGYLLCTRYGGLWIYQYQVQAELFTGEMKAKPVLPQGCQKITFTSGSTGTPKGVCLSAATQFQVAQSLVERIGIKQPRHLCLLPLSTLLENIAGIYAPLLAGGEVLLTEEHNRGFTGSSLTQPQKLLALISSTEPQTLILVPELLQLLVLACQQGWQAPKTLLFIAVGGARVAPELLTAAAKVGLPVYQGYGLSECGSVVALSTHNAVTATSQELLAVGKALPHLQLKIVGGELWVKTPFLGYLSDNNTTVSAESATKTEPESGWVATGDLASLSADGDLQIKGRKKNLLISSFGRNIHPEWVEAELLKNGLLQQAVLFGDAKPYCTALLYSAQPQLCREALQSWLNSVNASLPDYARVHKYHLLSAPLSESDGTLTANQRPKRVPIAERYQAEIAAMYQPEHTELSVPTAGTGCAATSCI